MVGPDLEPTTVNLSQIASGVYEAPIANLQSGAYAVASPSSGPARRRSVGRSGLVAPTAAEYRLLGANEALLAAIRAATGGREVATPADAWVHDLQTTSQFTELWPWLLVLALLLWPLDIALRRVSLGRRGWRTAGGGSPIGSVVGGSRPARSRSKGCSRQGTEPGHPAPGPRSCARPPTSPTRRAEPSRRRRPRRRSRRNPRPRPVPRRRHRHCHRPRRLALRRHRRRRRRHPRRRRPPPLGRHPRRRPRHPRRRRPRTPWRASARPSAAPAADTTVRRDRAGRSDA